MRPLRPGLEGLPQIPAGSGLLTVHRYRDQNTKYGYKRSMRYWVCWPAGEPAPYEDLVSVRLIAMLPTSFLDVPEEPAEPWGLRRWTYQPYRPRS